MQFSNKMTQGEEIIDFILEQGSITRLQAATELHVFELSSRIGELKNKGYKIASRKKRCVNRYGRVSTFNEYYLEGEI